MSEQNPSLKKMCQWNFTTKIEQLYLETDASGVQLGAGLLQVRNRMWFSEDETPDKTALWPITFAGKNLTIDEMQYSSF